jgi:hypothetical protein
MSFSDNLENNLKNMEAREEREDARARVRRQNDPSRSMAAVPFIDKLKNGPFTKGLLGHATRIGFGLRTKVHIVWLGNTLRLEAREHRLELRPTGEGVFAHWIVNGVEKRKEKLDLSGNPEALAKKWLDSVGPPPPPPAPDPDLESDFVE